MSPSSSSSKKRKAFTSASASNNKKDGGGGNSNGKKANPGLKNGGGNKSAGEGDDDHSNNDFALLTLEEIREKVSTLCNRVPAIPSNNFYLSSKTSGASGDGNDDEDTNNDDKPTNNNMTTLEDDVVDEVSTREWAAQLQAVLEEYNLLVCCVATATYRWGTDRSGAADQNLNLLNGELASSQDSISSTVTPRLTNVLAPVVDLVIDKTVTTYRDVAGDVGGKQQNDGKQQQHREEIKQNHFTRKLGTCVVSFAICASILCFIDMSSFWLHSLPAQLRFRFAPQNDRTVDPDFLQLCYKILARNAPLLRRVVLSNFMKVVKAMDDYLNAQKNDPQNSSRSFTY